MKQFKSNRLKFFSLMLCLSLTIGFISCGSDDDEPETPSGSGKATLTVNGKGLTPLQAECYESSPAFYLLAQMKGSDSLLAPFVFEFKYCRDLFVIEKGDDITEDIVIRSCHKANEILMDDSYDITSGSVVVKSVSPSKIVLQFKNCEVQTYVGSTKSDTYKFNGTQSYDILL